MSVRPLAQMGAFFMGEEKEEPPPPPPPPLGRGWRKAKQAIRVAQAVRPCVPRPHHHIRCKRWDSSIRICTVAATCLLSCRVRPDTDR